MFKQKTAISENVDGTYWMAVAHLPNWPVEKINRLIVKIVHEEKISWDDFFALDKKGWGAFSAFTEKELDDLEIAKRDMPRWSFLAEQLQNEGFQIIPIHSPDYPEVLKENLKIRNSPPILYIKGIKGLLQEDAVAIVGSRKAGDKALSFTDRVAKKSVKESKVIVSGFAKGVDRQALDSALEANGKSIIVLPQGILTFQSGFKKYYEPIVQGDVLVMSTFFPKAGWDVGLAMARNAYIYGLAKEIYVAESDDKGGTWEGAIDGLRRGRTVYVRYPEAGENNANLKLIELGATPVNMNGEEWGVPSPHRTGEERDIEKEILDFLEKGVYTSREILLSLKLDWNSRKLTDFLKKNPNVKRIDGKQKPAKFTRADVKSPTLF